MAIVQTTSPKMNGIDVANLVASLKPVDDALVAFAAEEGVFALESGSADINWTAVAAGGWPSANNPFTGGRTFRFDDPLQAEAPIYFRFQYGHGSTNSPAVFIQTGNGMYADGTLKNACVLKVLSMSVADNNPYPVWIAGGPNYITFAILGRTANGSSAVAIIERMRDEEGVETDEGGILLSAGAVNYPGRIQPIPSSPLRPVPADSTYPVIPVGGMSGIGLGSSDIIMTPIAIPFDGKWRYMKALGYRWSDIAHGTEFDLDYLGDNEHYVTLGNLAGREWAQPSSTVGIAARWE